MQSKRFATSVDHYFSSQLLLIHPPYYCPPHISNPERTEEFAWLRPQPFNLGPTDALYVSTDDGPLAWDEIADALGISNHVVVVDGLSLLERLEVSNLAANSHDLDTVMVMTLDEHIALGDRKLPFARAIKGPRRFEAVAPA